VLFFALHLTAMRTEIFRRRVIAMRRVAARQAN
jgi:heme exporter protein C